MNSNQIAKIISDSGIPAFPEGKVPAAQKMPFCEVDLKLATSDSSEDQIYQTYLRYDVRLFQSNFDEDIIFKVQNALDSAGIQSEIYTYQEPDECDWYTVFEITVLKED